MSEHDIYKALEIWVLQNLLNVSILAGILAAGLAMVQGYYRSLENRLTLRVSIELWQVFTILLVDVCLVFTVLVGYVVLNPDIMADIKIAVPFYPAATVLFAAALVVRLFHGGHRVGSPGFVWSLMLMLAANVVNILGFTFVAEAASGEYLAHQPCDFAFWTYLKTHLRSNADPLGLELAQATFYVCFPLLMAVFAWGVAAALRQIRAVKDQ
jgi:hypothetical protein